MSIESLKQQARRHEQNEEWLKALEQYQKAIRELEREEQADIGLINRVGDLFVRVGKLDSAVEYYDKAVGLYREAFLPNNAIAVCKKIIRNVPNRHEAYLRIGQIRAEQGFLSDARTNFLTYAERMQKDGNIDESFRALVEFCDLAPDEVDVRVTVADRMAASQRKDEAVAQLLIAYRHLTHSGEGDLAKGVEKKILTLDPQADLAGALAAGATSSLGADSEMETQFGEIDLGAPGPELTEDLTDLEEAAEAVLSGSDDDFQLAAGDDDDEDADEDSFDLPVMAFGDEDEAASEEEDEVELPMMSFGEAEEVGEEVELPTFDMADDAGVEVAGEPDEEEAVELPTFDFEEEPSFAEEAAAAVEEAHEEVAAERPQPAPAPPPAEPAKAADSGFVDLGAMILGDPSERKTTRFKVAYQEPTGDEEADFAKMLSQFKEKVSENIEAGDVRAHYDLGTAYKEMGLLEEAISAFQAALRASANHLPTYELMGQTFIDMGQPEAAVRTLQRALKIEGGVEDEFVGIYYYLARAYEALNKKESAVEYYDRVFSLDINFADVTERLRELR